MSKAVLVFALTVTACRVTPEPIAIAGEGTADSPILVMQPRVCLDKQADSVRRIRGTPGFVTTNEVLSSIRVALHVPRELGAFVASTCDDLVNLDDSPPRLDRFVASSELADRMRTSGARSVFVLEIDVRLVCVPRRGGPGEPCYEDDVRVTALLFDKTGKLVRAAGAHVNEGKEAVGVARAVLRVARPPGAEQGATPCRHVEGDLLDCT